MLGEIELVGAYVVIATLLLSIAIWNRQRWWIRATAITITFAFFFISWVSVRNLLGWPTEQELPGRFELLFATVQEPDEVMRTPGAIYVWAMSLPGEGPVSEADIYNPAEFDTRVGPEQMPRAYKLPYDRTTHREVHEAVIKIVQGTRQVGVTDRKPKKPGESEDQSEFSFYDRPDPILPPKAGEP
jgi:hypothetical protein